MTIRLGVALLCVASAVGNAQPDRISGAIDSSRRIALRTAVNSNLRGHDERGPVDPSFPIDYATLHLRPTPTQQAALEKLLADQQDPASPDYHCWLTPEEYADRFGLSRADIARITVWLESEGLKVNDAARGRRWITFSGTAANVARAFRTEFRHYLTDGVPHFANATAPSIPEALADVVAGVEGMDDYYPVPAGGRHPPKRAAEYTNSSGTHYLAPDDLATIYDLKPFYASGIDGTGISIAIVGNTQIDLTDVRNFRARFNLPPSDPKLVLVGPDPGVVAEDEAYLDLEWAGAVARNASLIFVYAKSTTTAVQYAVDQRLAPVLSQSFGTCEPDTSSLSRPIAQQASAEGITWMASSGDTGGAGCEHQGKLPSASKGLAVLSPASIPEVTAVGGTEFDDSGGSYWNSSNSNSASAKSYIPEKAWNDSWTNDELAASSGGASIFYPKPWWQGGPGVPADGARDVPDVALSASWSHDSYIVYANGSSYGQGGTSAAAPAFAGYVALLNQYLMSKGGLSKPGLGNINPTLYRLAQSAPSAFHDIVNGDNLVPCMLGTPDCINGSLGYTTGPGYDRVTGLGSIDGYQLASNWTSGTPTTTTVTAAPAAVSFNGTVTLTASVSASGGSPSGDVVFLLNETLLGTAKISGSGSSGTATLAISGTILPVGTGTITALFGGSGPLNASAGTTTITVNAPAAASAVVASITPNPVYQRVPDSSGHRWSCTMHLTNESAVATTLTKLTIDNTDYSSSIKSWFGTSAIGGNQSISATIDWKNVNAPMNMPFVFSGADANGATWSVQLSVPFVTRLFVGPAILLTTAPSVLQNSANDASCRWRQPLVLEEQGGYETILSTLAAGGADISSQLQQIFGTTTLAPFGRLEGALCWSSDTATGSKTVGVSGTLAEFPTDTVSASASTTLATSAAGATAAVSPASVTLSAGSSQAASATVALSFTGGSPAWTASVSPANYTTNWLTLASLSGTGAAQLKLSASAAGLSKGVYKAAVLIQSATAAPQLLTVPIALVVGGAPAISIGGVTNGASYKTVFAPGMLMSVFGTNLAPAAEHAGSVPLPFTMQGVTATVNGYAAPLLDVSTGQLNIQIPYEVGAGTAFLGVNNNGQVASFPFQVQAAAPGIFMTLDGATKLVPYSTGQRGQILLAFITGEGDVNPLLITGKTPTTTDVSKLPSPALPLTLSVGGVPATINFVGIPGGLVGATQINFTVPANAPLGPQPVVVTVGGVASAPVTLTVTQ
ncbi:MAG TPA: protease pro-enzyme activation domain-containing protein [Candidatus Acidoferrales bacterium]|nr:protease pro-enzyme activation domain-containing protein [Candidatus Acidoferrales bacterium]